MSENNQASATSAEKQFGLQKIYVKDASFESPGAPQVFTQKWEPEVNVELNSSSNALSDGVVQVVLTVTVTAKNSDKNIYLAEVQQAGIFNVKGFSDQEMPGLLGSYCPNILFPYAREVISDLVNKGGFPQLLLAPVNFDALLAQHLEKQKAKEQSEAVH